ncbi:MAG: acetolactate synthase [Gammaproteobacteria bacterium]|nr:acetolactate synthase [Gammaproteobacteria bacterium]
MPTDTATAVVETLAAHGVDLVYCVPGESFLPITDALSDHRQIELIVCRHEGGAALMAAAHARARGAPGVCMVSRGPGAMNAAIGLHVAHHDAEPVVFLIGQAPTHRLGRMALQEMNYAKTFSDTAKLVIEVYRAEQVSESLARAFHVARAGTPGPVVVVLPEDVLYATAEVPLAAPRPLAQPAMSAADTQAVLGMVEQAERPVVIAGGRVRTKRSLADLTAFAQRFRIPVVTAHRRLHTFDSRHPLAGGRLSNRAPAPLMELLRRSDLLIVLGERLGPSVSQGYTFPRAPKADQAMIHVWPDAAELGRVWQADLAIACDPDAFLQPLLASTPTPAGDARESWIRSLHERHRTLMTWQEASADDGVVFGRVTRAIDGHLKSDAAVTYDAGNFTSWVNRFINLSQDNMSIGATVGAMGAGVPSGVAAGLAARGRQVVVFVGDGGVMMTGNELATAIQYGIPLKIFIANNAAFGTIRMHQAKSFPGRVTPSTTLTNPDFARWGQAFGALGLRIENDSDVEKTVAQAMAYDGAVVVDVRTSLEYIAATARLQDLEG